MKAITCLVRRRRVLRVVFPAAIVCGVLCAASWVEAAQPAFGSTRELQQDAVRNVPLAKLTPSGRSLASKVINDTTIFRRLPQQRVECDPELYAFLIEHPDLCVNMWEVMGVTNVSLKRTGPASFHLDDGHGTTGDLHYLYRSPTQHLIYCDGTYSGSLMPRAIHGRCLVSLRSTRVRDADNFEYMQCRLDTFIQIENFGAEMLAKAFQTTIGNIADHNVREAGGFVTSVQQAAEAAPENLQRISSRCSRVTAEIRDQFAAITDRVYADVMGLGASAEPVGAVVGRAGSAADTAQRPSVQAAPRR